MLTREQVVKYLATLMVLGDIVPTNFQARVYIDNVLAHDAEQRQMIEAQVARIKELETFLSEDIAPFAQVDGKKWGQILPDGCVVPIMRGSPDLPAFIAKLHMAAAELDRLREEP